MTGQQVARYPVDVPGFLLGLAIDAAGNTFVNVVDGEDYLDYTALVELDPTGATIGTWSTAGQTIAVAQDASAIYLAGEGWPDLRAPTRCRSRDGCPLSCARAARTIGSMCGRERHVWSREPL